MKESKKQGLKVWGDLAFFILIAGTIGIITFVGPKRIRDNYFTESKFENIEWKKTYNPDGRIWDDYMKADIPHNQIYWSEYSRKVIEKNNGKLEGNILLPDFKTKEAEK